ncbi:MAG: hypothetical protein H8E72_05655 [Candidatus Marinimicrobia bacterium]|nr:hypothetical protein [Candidatus Neomarinimicrobiota bacterium]
MKEKITVIIILTSVVALLFHHQSRDTRTQITSVQTDVPIPEIPLTSMELAIDGLELPLEESIEIDECNMDPITTDNLPFKDVFSHFRKCLGSNQEFSWKGQSYLTLLAEEVENEVIQVADSTMVEKANESGSEVVTR